MPGKRTRPPLLLLAGILGVVLVLLFFVGTVEDISFHPRRTAEFGGATNPAGGMGDNPNFGIFMFFRVLLIAGLAVLVFLILWNRTTRRVYLALIAVFLGLMFAVEYIDFPTPEPGNPPLIEAEWDEIVEGDVPAVEEPEYEATETDYVLLAVILSSAAVLIGAVFFGRWLRRRRQMGAVVDTSELYDSLSEAARRIRLGEDPYTVVLFCYQEMIRILSKIGHINATYLTPREFEKTLAEFGISNEHIRQLTEIFEIVRYGAKTDESFAARALTCLDAIQEAHEAT